MAEKYLMFFHVIVCLVCIAFTALESFGQDILLIINHNHPHYDQIDIINEIYAPYFPHIIFYGPQHDSRVEYCDHCRGWYSYKSIAQAIKKYPGYHGYLWVHDDAIINPWNFERFHNDTIWIDKFKNANLDLVLLLPLDGVGGKCRWDIKP